MRFECPDRTGGYFTPVMTPGHFYIRRVLHGPRLLLLPPWVLVAARSEEFGGGGGRRRRLRLSAADCCDFFPRFLLCRSAAVAWFFRGLLRPWWRRIICNGNGNCWYWMFSLHKHKMQCDETGSCRLIDGAGSPCLFGGMNNSQAFGFCSLDWFFLGGVS